MTQNEHSRQIIHPVEYVGRFSIATGNIGPGTRNLNAALIEEVIDELPSAYVEVTVPENQEEESVALEDIAWRCYDGRYGKNKQYSIGTSAAGGSVTAASADMLGPQRFRHTATNAAEHTYNVLVHLNERGRKVGGHTDNHDHKPGQCGCGACNLLGQSFSYIAESGDEVRQVVEALGLKVSDEIHAKIRHNAASLVAEANYIVPGAQLVDAIVEVGGKDSVEVLEDEHNEIALVINMVRGTTLDHNALPNNDSAQIFALDGWSIDTTVDMMYMAEEDRELAKVSAWYYQVAVARHLVQPSLPIYIRREV